MSEVKLQQTIPFKGSSMSPLIKNGDKLIVEFYKKPKVCSKELKGAVCFYNDGKEWIAHRVLCYENDLYIKGDFAKAFDCNPGLLIWGLVVGVKVTGGKIISLKGTKKYNLLCHKFSVLHMVNKGWGGKGSKAMLYFLNTLKRNLG